MTDYIQKGNCGYENLGDLLKPIIHGGFVNVEGKTGEIGAGIAHFLTKIPNEGVTLEGLASVEIDRESGITAEEKQLWLQRLVNMELVVESGGRFKVSESALKANYTVFEYTPSSMGGHYGEGEVAVLSVGMRNRAKYVPILVLL